MARRRMIDPNIWGSEDMAKLTLRQRLLVIGLFSNSDDYGKGKAKATYVRSIVFPYDDVPIPDIIDDLEVLRATISIHFYEVEGNSYYKFINWTKWQTVQKPQPSIIPEPVENDSLLSPDPLQPKGKEEKRKEEKGPEEQKTALLSQINKIGLQTKGAFELDNLYSYLGVMEYEVILDAVNRSEKQKKLSYALGILSDRNGKRLYTINDLVTAGEITKPTNTHGELDAQREKQKADSRAKENITYEPAEELRSVVNG